MSRDYSLDGKQGQFSDKCNHFVGVTIEYELLEDWRDKEPGSFFVASCAINFVNTDALPSFPLGVVSTDPIPRVNSPEILIDFRSPIEPGVARREDRNPCRIKIQPKEDNAAPSSKAERGGIRAVICS